MTEAINTYSEPTTDETARRGRPQREGAAIALRELGFYDRLPKIREDSRDYLLSSRKRLLEARPIPKLTSELAIEQRENFRARRAKGAKLVEPDKFTLTTLDPQSLPNGNIQHFPAIDMIQYGSAAVVGHGTGWDLERVLGLSFGWPGGFLSGLDPNSNPEFQAVRANWLFLFDPPADGSYKISTGLVAWGNYTLISDDGPFDSHEVGASIVGGMSIGGQSQLFSRGDDNINEAESFACSDTVEVVIPASANTQLDIYVGFLATVGARGDDTFAQLDMTQAVGGMLCGGLTVEQVA